MRTAYIESSDFPGTTASREEFCPAPGLNDSIPSGLTSGYGKKMSKLQRPAQRANLGYF
jgi:hypothetical protein